MSLELDNDGPFSQRRTDRRREEAPAWPVLARLPRIEVAAGPRVSLPAFAQPEAPAGEPLLSYVDSPHVEAARGQSMRAPSVESFARPVEASAARHYRIDAAVERRATGRPHQKPADEASIADSVFRLHAALAPHRGFMSAAGLVIAASLVYWLTMGRQGAVAPPTELLNFGSGLTQEAAVEPEPAVAAPALEASVSTTLEAPAMNWSTPPRVANAPEAPADAAAPATDSATGAEGAGPTLPPAAEEAAPGESTSAALDVTPTGAGPMGMATLDNGITPTPDIEPYRTTPYPAFSFVEQASAPAAAAMAERPTPGASADAAVAR